MIVRESSVREEAYNLWDMLGIQIFVFGGDVTLLSKVGILSQMPELQEDNLYFDLTTSGDFELQYIMYHEQPDSRLWQLLVALME